MMFDPERAEIRFGCGLSPRLAPAGSTSEMLARLKGPDEAARRFEIPRLPSIRKQALKFADARDAYFHAETKADRQAGKKRYKVHTRAMRQASIGWFGQTLLRRVHGEDGMRERLTAFWADHFTAVGRDEITRMAHPIYIEEAIRPYVSGRFIDMLREVTTHPLMLVYLDQNSSIGPNSSAARNRKKNKKKKSGLNENLARELLELHTLGVKGPYTQQDVRQLAELLTGLHFSIRDGVTFKPNLAEPGAETILGTIYGGDTPKMSDINALLFDLAVHPVTAAHLSRKLAVHFISDTPDPALIEAMTKRYLETASDLHAVYEVMLNHPSAWDFSNRNVKQPLDFVSSTLRALDIAPDHPALTKPSRLLGTFFGPMTLMGQAWGQAPGPDGWPEADEQWITPQRLAARLQWAMSVPYKLRRVLPHPREFVEVALGRDAPEAVRFAAGAAESRTEGVGLILASPAFQRM
nr:DUF1800 domain-containing protein [uncultured Roseovarius sp.]